MGILARDDPLSKVERERDQRPRFPEPEHDENNQVCFVSSLSDQITEDDHERQAADGGIDIRRRLTLPNQPYHHHCQHQEQPAEQSPRSGCVFSPRAKQMKGVCWRDEQPCGQRK